jgi:hypothetical protein
MNKILVLLFISFSFYNCSSKSEKEQLFEDIMKTHDELMPKLEDISSLSKQLKEKATDESAQSKSGSSNEINKKVSSLHDASASMMNWMRNFNTSYDTLPEKIAVNYLKEEKMEVEQLKKKMDLAINEAKEAAKK